jgi:HlyD family secretion protein
MRLSKKLVLIGFAVAVAAAIVYAALPKPIPVDVARTVRGPIQVTVEEDGKTRVKERYTVSAPLAGRLLRIGLDPGDRVEAGKTLIGAIEPAAPDLLDVRTTMQAEARVSAARAAIQRASHALNRAQADHQNAVAHLARLRQALEGRAVSQQDVNDAQARERMAFEAVQSERYAVQVAEFELDQARAALLLLQSWSPEGTGKTRFEVFSPISGFVLRVLQESESMVLPGERLVELGNPADIEVEVDVLSSDAVKIRPGAKVFLERWGGDTPLLARVRLIEPSGFLKISALGVEEQRVNVIIDLVDPEEKWRNLGDGFRVDARIVTAEAEDVLKVPTGALFRQDGEWSVFVYQEGKAQLRPVKIGKRNDLEAEILEGLDENTTVITYPGDKIRDNAPISPR